MNRFIYTLTILIFSSQIFASPIEDEMDKYSFKRINLTSRNGQTLLEDSRNADIADNGKTRIIAGYVYKKFWQSAKHREVVNPDAVCKGLDYEKAISFSLKAISNSNAKRKELYKIHSDGSSESFSNTDIVEILKEADDNFETLTIYKEIICMKKKGNSNHSFPGISAVSLKKQYEVFKFNKGAFNQSKFNELNEDLQDEIADNQKDKSQNNSSKKSKKYDVDISANVIEAMSTQL